MKKVGLIAHNLYAGGITSYLIEISRYLCEKNVDVILYYEDADEECLKKFDDSIEKKKMSKNPTLKVILKILLSTDRMRFLNAIIKKDKLTVSQLYSCYNAYCHEDIDEKFDVAISSEEFFCNELLAWHVHAKKKIGWIHPDYKSIKPIEKIDKMVFEQLDKIVTVSETNRKLLMSLYPNIQNKFMHINNILDEKKIWRLSQEKVADFKYDETKLNIITVCRLDNISKRIDRIVKTCVFLKHMKVPYKWYIVGDGKDREIIDKWINDNDLTSDLILLGNKVNPYPYYRKADVFVLTSVYEGKPISVEEAKILHTPVIVTNYNAAKEQVGDCDGFVIENCDSRVPEEIYFILKNNLFKIKKWSSDYRYDNTKIFEQIDNLLLD